jgi:hypothetical protein
MIKPTKLISVDDVLAKEEELVELRKQAIAQILEERKSLDEKLARLGYTEGAISSGGKAVKKRTRRTKAELEAARAASEK